MQMTQRSAVLYLTKGWRPVHTLRFQRLRRQVAGLADCYVLYQSATGAVPDALRYACLLYTSLHANKSELLMVLDRPETPLNTNGSENDIRCQVIRRKVSAGTRSDLGRDCRDAFLGLTKTCTKLGVAFWDYLGSRLRTPGHLVVPLLPGLVRCRGQPA